MRYLRIFLAAMIVIMPAATVYAAPAIPSVKQPETATAYREFAGTISFINESQVVIDNIPFALKSAAVPDFGDFAPGDHVLVHLSPLNGAETIVAMFHLASPNRDGARHSVSPGSPPAQPVAAPRPAGQTATPVSQGAGSSVKPGGSAPIKQQNGVWTN